MRIEDYGAFVQFGRWRGLVHISQMSSMRVEKVSDFVELKDPVWVKVVQIEDAPPRYKIRLTMKDIPQDGTAPAVHAADQQAQQASRSLEQNLNSNIGIAIARDPMEGIVLKRSGKQSNMINGYALLQEEEEEEKKAVDTAIHHPVTGLAPRSGKDSAVVKPVGRGRGATIPAWMAKQQQTLLQKAPPEDDDRSSGGKDRGKKKKKKHDRKSSRRDVSRRDDDRRRRRRDDSGESSDESSGRDAKRRHRKKRRTSSRSRGRSDSRKRGRKQSHRSSSENSSYEQRRRRRDDSESSEDEGSHGKRRRDRQGKRQESGHSSDESDTQFTNVEEARRLVEEIEARRKNKKNDITE
jgi:predicted RNA-binding protein with RPS1 domain